MRETIVPSARGISWRTDESALEHRVLAGPLMNIFSRVLFLGAFVTASMSARVALADALAPDDPEALCQGKPAGTPCELPSAAGTCQKDVCKRRSVGPNPDGGSPIVTSSEAECLTCIENGKAPTKSPDGGTTTTTTSSSTSDGGCSLAGGDARTAAPFAIAIAIGALVMSSGRRKARSKDRP